jgi:hypothetical protein
MQVLRLEKLLTSRHPAHIRGTSDGKILRLIIRKWHIEPALILHLILHNPVMRTNNVDRLLFEMARVFLPGSDLLDFDAPVALST